MSNPKILLSEPTPTKTKRKFAGQSIAVWQGYAELKDISGWIDNPRLKLELDKFKRDNTGRAPTQDEVAEIMSAVKEFAIADLATNIRENGVRVPLILAPDGVLLDGNRRFFASLRALNDTPKGDPHYKELSKVPVIILDDSATKDDQNLVLWHENFHPENKIEWSDYIKAKYIQEALDRGLSDKEVQGQFGWKPAKIKETRKIMFLIEEYKTFATSPAPEGLAQDDLSVEQFVNDKYQYFNEAQKSFYEDAASDFEFRSSLFKWLSEDKFASFGEVRVARKAYSKPKYKKILDSDHERAGRLVETYVKNDEAKSQEARDVASIINDFKEDVTTMTAPELASLSDDDLNSLKQILENIIKMAESLRDK